MNTTGAILTDQPTNRPTDQPTNQLTNQPITLAVAGHLYEETSLEWRNGKSWNSSLETNNDLGEYSCARTVTVVPLTV